MYLKLPPFALSRSQIYLKSLQCPLAEIVVWWSKTEVERDNRLNQMVYKTHTFQILQKHKIMWPCLKVSPKVLEEAYKTDRL